MKWQNYICIYISRIYMSQSSRTGKTREGSPSKSLEERRGANVGGMEPETMKKHDSELA